MNRVRLKAFFLLTIVSIIWGIAGPVIKLTVKEIPPFIFLSYRFLISSLVAIPVLYFTKFRFSKNFKTNVKIFLASFLNTTGALGLLFYGASKTTLLQMSLITAFGPILSVLAGYLFLKDKITHKERIGILIAFLGSVLIVVEPFFSNSKADGNFYGNLGVFGYILFTTISGVLIKQVLRDGINPIGLTNLSFIIGLVTVVPIALFLYPNHSFSQILNSAFQIPLRYHMGVWYMALISGSFAFSLQNIAQKSIELSELAVFMYLYPILSGILAIFLLHDKFTVFTGVGSVTTTLGIIIAEVKKKRYN